MSSISDNYSLKEVGNHIRKAAKSRWLFPEEIYLLLIHGGIPLNLEENVIIHPHQQQPHHHQQQLYNSNNGHGPYKNSNVYPASGTIYLYDDTVSFKNDGVVWAKKKSQDRIQETYMNLKINGKELIRGIYCKGQNKPNFRRRMYRLIDQESNDEKSLYEKGKSGYNSSSSIVSSKSIFDNGIKKKKRNLHLVHYRECPDDEKPERPVLSPLISYHLNIHLLPKYLDSTSIPPPFPQIEPFSIPEKNLYDSQFNNSSYLKNSTNTNQYPSSTSRNTLYLTNSPSYSSNYSSNSQSTSNNKNNSFVNDISNLPTPQILDLSPSFFYSTTRNYHNKMIIITSNHFWSILYHNYLISTGAISSNTPMGKYEEKDFTSAFSIRISEHEQFNWWYTYNFEFISSNAIRFLIPENTYPGKWFISIVPTSKPLEPVYSSQNVFIDFYPYDNSNSINIEESFPMINEIMEDSIDEDDDSKTTSDDSTPPFNESTLSYNNTDSNKRSFQQIEVKSEFQKFDDTSRQHKIRIVERLETIINDNACENIENIDSSSLPPIEFSENFNEVFRDDQGVEKSTLSIEKLEEILDNYINILSTDNSCYDKSCELREQINSLDSFGFSLLHYCCIYNIPTLIPFLLLNGADINLRTKEVNRPANININSDYTNQFYQDSTMIIPPTEKGINSNSTLPFSYSTPLHLAVESHHIEVVKILLSNKDLNIEIRDSNFMSPFELALSLSDDAIIETFYSFYPNLRNLNDKNKKIYDMSSPISNSSTLSFSKSFDTSKVLQTAFSSLSITDKCALSLSINSNHSSTNTLDYSRCSSPQNLSTQSSPRSCPQTPQLSKNSTPRKSISCNSSPNTFSQDEFINEIRPILPNDQEFLNKLISMMGQKELRKVEEESKQIQDNGKAWLIKKNLINLKDAVLLLQTTWREKKKIEKLSKNTISIDSVDSTSNISKDSLNPIPLTSVVTDSSSKELENDISVTINHDTENNPSITSKFSSSNSDLSSIHREALASIVIQKYLLNWWKISHKYEEKMCYNGTNEDLKSDFSPSIDL